VIDSSERTAALAIIDAWNDQARWTASPWAARDVFQVVTVHEATAGFVAPIRKEMVAAPTIAVFSDGNEDIATGYLRSAGIPQSDGSEFPVGKCGAANCGPGTANPDMLTVPSIMGAMGTCDAPNYDHKNGALFTSDGLPAYCQIMSMHWDVNDREKVECAGGNCPATQAECADETITYHGHEVVAEVRKFLEYPTHFFAECQAVNAYENTTPNPAWPYLDDDARNGHFLTTQGSPPACTGSCADGDFECVVGGCGGGTIDCCLPKDVKEKGAGFMIAAQPNSNTLQILHPDVAYNQFEGFYQTVGGSEPAYNLSTFLGTMYQNNREVTFITGPNGPGDQDVWMTGFVDGECDIVGGDDVAPPNGECNGGKVSYLGGHRYATDTPLSANGDTQGARLFLNALFEADCVTSIGQPRISLTFSGDLIVAARSVPVEGDYLAGYVNGGRGIALDGVLSQVVPNGATLTAIAAGGTMVAAGAEWTVGSISASPPNVGDPPNQGSRSSTVRFDDFGDYTFEVNMQYRVGTSNFEAASQQVTVRVLLDSDGDGVPDELDPDPNDPMRCGDSDSDTCDDCSVTGMADPSNDGPDQDANGICDAGEGGMNPGDGDDAGGCGCGTSSPVDAAPWIFIAFVVAFRRRRRRE
jgi:MYXO-CTERM domain-containing protein